MVVQDAGIGFQIARIFSNALFFLNLSILFRLLDQDMATKRIAMRKIREVLRLRFSAESSIRQISAGTKISVGSIQNFLILDEQQGLSWPLPDDLDDQALALRLYPSSDARPSSKFQQPVWPEIQQELKRKDVTKQLLLEEYTRQYPNRCYSYSQFCAPYANWRKRSMRQTHRVGENMFIDYAGRTVPIVCASSGELCQASIFVAGLGASNGHRGQILGHRRIRSLQSSIFGSALFERSTDC